MNYTTPELLRLLEEKISNLSMQGEPHALYTPIEYILEDGGKRIRPLLSLLACGLYKSDPMLAVSSAMAVEVFHNFTLLHDDIMDQAPLRRGRQTAHLLWGQNSAILSGDAMLILAYKLLCEGASAEVLPSLLEVFNRAALQVCEGQQWDMEFESSPSDITIEQYTEMIRLKTAVLLAAALEMGAIVGGATTAERRALYDFGVNLGLAFQIQDDLLDTYGDQHTFGKTIGGDIAVGKKTFLHITALARADASQRQVLLCNTTTVPASSCSGLSTDERFRQVRNIYDTLDVRNIAECSISEYFVRAIELLRLTYPCSTRRAMLEECAYSLIKRTK